MEILRVLFKYLLSLSLEFHKHVYVIPERSLEDGRKYVLSPNEAVMVRATSSTAVCNYLPVSY